MLKPLFKFEEGVLRVEKWILVGCVLLMLALAGYTVFYRNVLVAFQNHLATSGPPVAEQVEPVDASPTEVGDPADEPESDDFGGGFGGGFGEEPSEADEADEADENNDFGGGFGGGFDEEPSEADEADEAGGFGGGFGGEPVDEPDVPDSDVAEPDVAEPDVAEPVGGPPPQDSLAAHAIETINAVKFDWLDVLLRQLVIICGFLGAMLATRQRSHITVDAVGTLLKGRTKHIVETVTSVAAAAVCVFWHYPGGTWSRLAATFPGSSFPGSKIGTSNSHSPLVGGCWPFIF
jgi:TRAP-type C4-dicarboxylate transport system permease small subunit